jgi:hypothetical protein
LRSPGTNRVSAQVCANAHSARKTRTAWRPRNHVAIGGIVIAASSVSMPTIASTSPRSHASA